MKPILAKVMDGLQDQVMLVRVIDRPVFSTEFHFHAECQLTYVVKSSGHKVVGDCIENFEPGELTFLGSDLPHVWHNDADSVAAAQQRSEHAQSVALFLHPEKLLHHLGAFVDTRQLEKFLQTSRRGMKFYGDAKKQITEILLRMVNEASFKRAISLLEILQILCNTNEYQHLASAGYINLYQTRENERIDKVFKYLFDHFSEKITLDELAAQANMNKQAFCRFFKMRTQKTPVEFLNEIRVAHAIRLMTQEQLTIATIAFHCGYNTMSNFNKFFREVTGKTPSEYRRQLHRSA